MPVLLRLGVYDFVWLRLLSEVWDLVCLRLMLVVGFCSGSKSDMALG